MPLARATVALVALAVVIGCGGDEPTAVVRDANVKISLDEFYIQPQNIDVRAGHTTITVADRGRLRHSFRLWGADSAPVEIETIFPGETTTKVADLAPGAYRMVCTVSNHAELGMTGKLVVR
ncbi:MAG TPA: cupredoxin domain-containing protein [Solirubrobacteraceae bacterium]|nr:cupredoxin domain-containing protein [Solirubrobacteraceae bacterium]